MFFFLNLNKNPALKFYFESGNTEKILSQSYKA